MNEYMKKIVLLGDGAVGKTSLVRRFVDKKFSDSYIATIGANFKKKVIDYPSKDIRLRLIVGDLIGQQGFEETQRTNMRGSNSALMVCDLTRIETIDSLESYWIPLLEEVSGSVPPLIFLANKSDLVTPESEEAREYRAKLLYLSEKYNSKFLFTSAKVGENVEQAFNDIGLMTLDFEPDSCYHSELYRPKGEISNLRALDLFKAQFYLEIGGAELASSILQNQFKNFGIDVRHNPTKKQLEQLVDEIKKIEKNFIPSEKVSEYHTLRKGILAKIN